MSYNPYSDPYQQPNPYEPLPPPPPVVPPTQLAKPEKKKGGNKGRIWTGIIVPILVAIIGLSAHAATSEPSKPSIPQLHSTYSGILTDLVYQKRYQLSFLDVSEDSNGNFQAAATVDQSCTATISKASVNTSGAVTFQLDLIANSTCSQGTFAFSGQINGAEGIIGTWTEPNSSDGDNGTFTLS